jgi:transposase InsO family protein
MVGLSRFGVPAVITSDRGAQFTSALWAALCSLLNIHHMPTTAFHPEGNGLVERLHRRMKDALRARAAHADWAAHLPWVMLSLRAAPREDDGRSPAEALYGSQLVVPGQFLDGVSRLWSRFCGPLRRLLTVLCPAPARHNIPVDSKPV